MHRSVLAGLVVMTASGAIACSYGPEVRGPFRGQVVDADAGKPLEGVVVLVSWPFEQGPLRPRDVYDAQEAVTDRYGSFEVRGLQSVIIWPSVLAPELYLFLPGYEWTFETRVTPPAGREFVDPTITTMRPLLTLQQRCASLDRPGGRPLAVDFVKMRRFFEAQNTEYEALKCGRIIPEPGG